MNYEKQATSKKSIAAAIVICLIIIACFFAFITFKRNNNPNLEKSNICNFNVEEANQKLNNKIDKTYVSDYMHYGDSLYLLENKYSSKSDDRIVGNIIILKNICDGSEHRFLIEKGMDRGILLNTLSEGLYEIYMEENLSKTRVYSNTSIYDRSNVNGKYGKMQVTLATFDKLKHNENVKVDNKLLFLNIEKKDYKQADIILDPAGNTVDYSSKNNVSKGVKGNGIVEANETYKLAEMIKKDLESKGFNVLISRKKDEVVDFFGDNGRLNKAYKNKARYYIYLGFNEAEDGYYGFKTVYSTYSSKILANQIAYNIKSMTSLRPSEFVSNLDYKGLQQSPLVEGNDGKIIYDSDMIVRELGGRITNAGYYSDTSKLIPLARKNNNGIQAIDLNLGYVTNSKDANNYLKDKKKVAKAISKALYEYIKMEN